MTARVTVFVCGTYSDLSEERGAILDAIQRLQLHHDSMEFFGARPEQPIDTCLNEVRTSDILVVIVGRKYGSVVPDLGISYSEAEYREAQRLNLPCLVYIRDEQISIAPELAERDPDKIKKLRAWKDNLKQKHTVYAFKDSGDLALQVAADLIREITKLEKTLGAIESSVHPTTAHKVRMPSPETCLNLQFCERFGDEARQLLYGLTLDSEGNVIIAGSFWGAVNFGGTLLKSSGDRSIFVAKFDRTGRHQWSRRFGDSAEKVAVGVEADPTGAIFIVSAFTGMLDFGGSALVSKGRYSIALAKLDPNGCHLWSRSFGDDGYYVPECFAVAPDGRVVVAGRFAGSLDFGGGRVECQSSQTDIFLASVSSQGEYLWAKRFGGPSEQQTRSIAINGDGKVALGGVFKGSINFDGQQLTENQPGEYCGFLAKFDDNGNTLWCKRFGEPFAEQGSAVAFDHYDGHIIASGFIRNKLPAEATGEVQSLCLFARYDPSGILQWSKTFGACAFPDTLSVIPGGEILLTGHFEMVVDFGLGPLVSAGGNDIFAAIFASDGTPLWSRRFGDARQQFLVRGVHNPSGLVAFAGSFHGTIDFGNGPMVASGYDGINEGTEDIFLALFEAERISPKLPITGSVQHGMELQEKNDTQSGIYRVGRVVGGGLLALFVALVLGALTVFGVNNIGLGHLLLFLAWAVGAILISTELMARKTAKQKISAVLGLLLFFLGLDWGILKLKRLQDISSRPNLQTSDDSAKEPKVIPSPELKSGGGATGFELPPETESKAPSKPDSIPQNSTAPREAERKLTVTSFEILPYAAGKPFQMKMHVINQSGSTIQAECLTNAYSLPTFDFDDYAKRKTIRMI